MRVCRERREWERSTHLSPEQKEIASFERSDSELSRWLSTTQAKPAVVDIREIWKGDFWPAGGMRESYTTNSHTNPMMDLTYLYVLYLDAFAIASTTTKSCYVFMKLLDVEDGRPLHFEIHVYQATGLCA